MLKFLYIPVAILFLGACAAQFGDRLDKLDAIIGSEVDVMADRIEDRRCKLPVDVLERMVNERGLDWFEGWSLQCPAAKRLFDSVQQPVNLSPPETVIIE